MRVMEKNLKYVIIDTDGGVDDAWAIAMMVKSEHKFNIKILAITCVFGNTTTNHVSVNSLKILEILKRLDIPIYKGAEQALLPFSKPADVFYGKDGWGDVLRKHDFTDKDNSLLIKQENAVNALHRLISENPKNITLICLGPLTNIALALRTYSDFGSKVKEIYIMGGNHSAIGNITECAEFNFYMDPESAFIVLNTLKCPITILPWETCMPKNTNISLNWRINNLGVNDDELMKLLNPIDLFIFQQFDMWCPCDAFLVALFLHPLTVILSSRNCNVTVECYGFRTRGQLVIDHMNRNENNAVIIDKLSSDVLMKIFLDIF